MFPNRERLIVAALRATKQSAEGQHSLRPLVLAWTPKSSETWQEIILEPLQVEKLDTVLNTTLHKLAKRLSALI
jgi:hypothetical protein